MKSLLPNPYLLVLGVTLLSYFLLEGIKLILSTRISRFIGDRKNKWDDIIVFTVEKTTQIFIIASSFHIALKFSKHPRTIDRYANRIYFVIFMWQVAIWSHHLLQKWVNSVLRKKIQKNPAAASSVSLIQFLARMVLFTVIFLFTLSNLDIRITTIIAGLGVGGIAVALALQKILGDLFASLSIVLDRPFMVGDFIIIDQYMGEVEKIGLKTTRIRSLSGEQLIFSNSDMLDARIRNYKRMQERRVPFILSLPLQTSLEKVKTAVSLISAIIRTKRSVRFERCHLMRIAATLEIEIIYWVLSDDYDLYMDIQQDILFDIKNAFEGESIEFAYPTQAIQVLPTEVAIRSDFGPGTDKSVASLRS